MPAESKLQSAHEVVEKLRQAESLIQESLRLLGGSRAARAKPSTLSPEPRSSSRSIRFDLNERAYVKTVARQQKGGARKFVVLLAYLAKGNVKSEVDVKAIKKMWNRTSAKDMLGMKYNRAFPTRARSEGWVDSKKRGIFVLEETWQSALTDGNS